MEIFPCGQPDQVLDSVTVFIEMADAMGTDCGYSSEGADDSPAPTELGRQGGIIDLPDDNVPHAILVIGGRGRVRCGGVAEIAAGQGVIWAAGEEFDLEVVDEPLVFYQLESSALRREHLVV